MARTFPRRGIKLGTAGMFEVENILQADQPIGRVWDVLTAFAEFEQWHPYVWIEGRAVYDGVIRYGLKQLAGLPARRTVPARVLHFEPGRTLGWRLWVPRLLTVDEIYTLSGAGARTVVRHHVRCEGLIAGLIRRPVSRKVKSLLERADAALATKVGDPVAGRPHAAKRR